MKQEMVTQHESAKQAELKGEKISLIILSLCV